jgi:hypothetical protein
VAAAVGVERAEQAVAADHLEEPAQARERSFLLDQKGGVDLAGGIIEGDDQIERRLAGEPGVARAVLEQQHARQRPAWPLLAVRRALGRLLDQAGDLQDALGPGLAGCGNKLAMRLISFFCGVEHGFGGLCEAFGAAV